MAQFRISGENILYLNVFINCKILLIYEMLLWVKYRSRGVWSYTQQGNYVWVNKIKFQQGSHSLYVI